MSESQSATPVIQFIELRVEPAPMLQRTLAFAMDLSLLTVIAVFLLEVILLPSEFPHELQETRKLMHDLSFYDQIQAVDELSPSARNMAVFSFNTYLFCFWVYFFLSELFMKGTSLGKKTFGLAIVSVKTGEKPGVFDSSFRALSKALGLMALPPFLLLFNYFAPFFNKSRRAGHDFICKTMVVQMKQTNTENDVSLT